MFELLAVSCGLSDKFSSSQNQIFRQQYVCRKIRFNIKLRHDNDLVSADIIQTVRNICLCGPFIFNRHNQNIDIWSTNLKTESKAVAGFVFLDLVGKFSH